MGIVYSLLFGSEDVDSLDISNRGVRLEVLLEVCKKIEAGLLQLPKDGKDRSPGERIVHGLVKPITETKTCSYSEYLYGDPNTRSLVGKCNVFLSHPWRADFDVTVAAIVQYEKNLPSGSPPQFYFCDYFAINQHRPADDLDELEVMVRSCDTLALMAVPWRKPESLTRLWCIFEIAHAALGNTELQIILPPKEEEDFQQSLKNDVDKDDAVWGYINKIFAQIDSKNAKASVESDVQNIQRFIKDKLQGFVNVDTVVADGLRGWFLKAALAMLENFDEAKKGSLAHAAITEKVALFCEGQSLHAESARFYGEAAAIYRKNNSSKWLRAELDQLHRLRKMGKAQEALPIAVKNYKLHVEEFGATDKATLGSKRMLGATYRELGKHAEAEETLRSIMDVYDKQGLERSAQESRVTQFQLAWAVRNNGKLDEAAHMYQELININTKRVGSSDPSTLVCVSNYARCLALSMKTERAVPLYKEAIPVLRVAWGADDQQVILGKKWLQEALSQMKSLPQVPSEQVERKQ